MGKKRYHVLRKNKADLRVLLRSAVTAYLLYLAWKLAAYSGDDPSFPPALRYAAGGLFAIGAIAFGIFTLKSYLAGLREAELTDEELEALHQDEDPEQ